MRSGCGVVACRASDLVARYQLIRRCSSSGCGPGASDMDTVRRRVHAVWSRAQRPPSVDGSPSPAPAAASKTQSRALAFALHGSLASSAAAAVTRLTHRSGSGAASAADEAEVRWLSCERPDFCLQYVVPEQWQLHESVRENHVAIQCRPGDGVGTSHGIVVNCFAYHRKVQEPSTTRLLESFLRRFAQVVQPGSLRQLSVATGGSDEIIQAQGTSESVKATVPTDCGSLASLIASRVPGTAAVVEFFPAPGAPLSRGVCRAFYSANFRYHYVLLVAVPAEDWVASSDYVLHVIMSARDSRVSRGAQNF